MEFCNLNISVHFECSAAPALFPGPGQCPSYPSRWPGPETQEHGGNCERYQFRTNKITKWLSKSAD